MLYSHFYSILFLEMTRTFRPLAKIPVKISFKSYDRPKKRVWGRGFVKIVDNGEFVELSSYYKDHANLPIERLYKNKLRGSDVHPYIFSIRLDANHPENQGRKLIRLNFNGNREGYEYALNSINNAFETFSHRFINQVKKLLGPENEEQMVQNDKKTGNKVQLNTDKKQEQEKSLNIEKAANVPESLLENKTCAPSLPNSRSAVVLQLLRTPPPQPNPDSWTSEFDRLMGGPEEVSPPKVNNPQEEERLAEIRRRNDLKLEQRRKERAEKRKKKATEKPIQEVVSKKKKIVEEGEIHAKKPIETENDSSVKELEDTEKKKKTCSELRTVLYDFGNEMDSLNSSTELVFSLSPDQKSSRKNPVDVRKWLAVRQGSVVKNPRKDSEQTSGKVANRSEKSSSSSSKASSSKPTKKVVVPSGASSFKKPRKVSEKTNSSRKCSNRSEGSSSQPFVDMWPSRIRGFSPIVSAPRKSKKTSISKPKKPEKPKKKLLTSSKSELSTDEPTNKYKYTPRASARTHEMDLDYEASSAMDPPSGETSGYFSTGNQSSSTSGFQDSQYSLQDVKLEPIDNDESEPAVTSLYMPMERKQIEQKSVKKLENVHRGQHYVGMTLTHTTIINSRLVDCDIQYSTIVNCVIENSSISNSRIISQNI